MNTGFAVAQLATAHVLERRLSSSSPLREANQTVIEKRRKTWESFFSISSNLGVSG